MYRPDGTLKAPGEWDEATDATVAGVETDEQIDGTGDERVVTRTRKVKRWDKCKALDLFMRHFGLLKEDAPHSDVPKYDLSKLTDEQNLTLLAVLRLVAGH